MKAREIRKIIVVLMGALMISSALLAAPGGNSGKCSNRPGTEGTTWGGNGPGGPRVSSTPTGTLNDPCAGTTVSTTQTQTEHGNGLANAFGRFMNRLGAVLDGAIWGGNGYNPPPR